LPQKALETLEVQYNKYKYTVIAKTGIILISPLKRFLSYLRSKVFTAVLFLWYQEYRTLKLFLSNFLLNLSTTQARSSVVLGLGADWGENVV
jgi:hypothetical protein